MNLLCIAFRVANDEWFMNIPLSYEINRNIIESDVPGGKSRESITISINETLDTERMNGEIRNCLILTIYNLSRDKTASSMWTRCLADFGRRQRVLDFAKDVLEKEFPGFTIKL